MELAPGTRIGRYTVEALLGRGGMASVFRVRHDELGTHYALKLLDMTSPVVRERLIEEGRMQSRLRHPNVVSVFDVVVHDNCPGLVMEYVDGPSLHLLIHSEPDIPPAVRDAIVTGIVYGVRAAHRTGLVHRDLKPANILLARTDEQLLPKVADFGLAKAVASDESPNRRTQTGSFLGTPVYMSPEQVRNARDVDERADVYALGVIFYELVARRLPVDSEDLIDLFSRIVKRDYPRPRELVPDLPQCQEDAILGALEPDPSRRIPDCDVLLAVWRGKIRFEPDSTPFIERTSPFDLAFLQRAAKLGAGDGLQPPADPQSTTAPPTPPAPPPLAASSVPTEQLAVPYVAPARSVSGGSGTTAAFVLGGAGALGALLGVAGLLVVGVGAIVWAWRTGADDEPPRPVPIAAPSPSPVIAPPSVPIAPTPVVEVPVPAPAPAPPSGAPKPRPKPTPGATGTVRVTGDALDVWLLRDGKRMDPGSLPAGVYQVEAEFPGRGAVRTPLSIAVVPNEVVTVQCVASFATCKLPNR